MRLGRSTDDLTTLRSGTKLSEFNTTQDQFSWQNDIKLPWARHSLAAEYLRQTVDGTTSYTEDERTIRSLLAGWTAGIDNHRLQFNLRRDDNSQFGGRTTGSATYGYQFDAGLAGTSFPMARRFAHRPSTNCTSRIPVSAAATEPQA